MIRSEMKNYNMMLKEKQQNTGSITCQVKLINVNILQM